MDCKLDKNSRCGCTMVHHYSNISTDSVTSATKIEPFGDFTYGCADDQFYNIAGNTTIFFRDVVSVNLDFIKY